jgi:chromosomal replication initiator protein
MSTVKALIGKNNSHDIGVNDIKKAIVGHFNISVSQLLSDQKKYKFSYPRQLGMYLSRRLTVLSLKEIGDAFGKKDHSTVLYAVRRMETYVNDGKSSVLDDINKLLNLLS